MIMRISFSPSKVLRYQADTTIERGRPYPPLESQHPFGQCVVPYRGTHLRRDTVIPQWFQASKAAAASDGHAVHCWVTAVICQLIII
jgi:hypothetical protein